MKKTFETSLPEGYRAAYVFDAKDNKKTVLAMNVANIIVTVAAIALFWVILRPLDGIKDGSADISGVFENILSRYLIFIVTIVAYLVLHKLTHGAAYWLITRQKLKFGFTPSVAYCGVPDLCLPPHGSYRAAGSILRLYSGVSHPYACVPERT